MGKNQTLLVVLCLALLTSPLLAAPVEKILKEDVVVKHVQKRAVGLFLLGSALFVATPMLIDNAIDRNKKKNKKD
ncbi:hypothetical protein PoB_004636200 [Plakobranchus ocellatus]|uniref:Uncharacterized protein n=1 Tax=Plakobranchus ocellatus TaxID=259542 RepID=A0AAV4BKE7_9GAST|nr:hypothetical protein PoB_004636200 [Plakobranchus ocellatus]